MTTLTLQPSSATGIDCHIVSNAATTNNGTAFFFTVGSQATGPAFWRGLISFDISAIAAGSVVSSATLTLLKSGGTASTIACTAFRCTQPFTNTGATWNNYAAGSAWTSAGGDWDPALSASYTIPSSNVTYTINVTAIAQDAVDNRSGMLRLLLKMNTEAAVTLTGDSRPSDWVVGSDRPKLDVIYAAGGGGTDSPPDIRMANNVPYSGNHSHRFGG